MDSQLSRGRILKWIAISTAALIALHEFFVQELIAELLIFTVLFGCIAVVGLVLLALDQAWQFASSGAETLREAFNRSMRERRVPVDSAASVNLLTPVLRQTTGPVVVNAAVNPFAPAMPSHAPVHAARGFALSAARQALSGRMDSLFK